MKKIQLLVVIGLLITVLIACGNNNDSNTGDQTTDTNDTTTQEVVDEVTDDTPADESPSDEGANPVDFRNFDLSIELNNATDDDIVEVDYEAEGNSVEAEYEDRNQGINLSGQEAEDELVAIFNQLSFDENTPDDEVIDQVLDAFGIQEEQIEFDLDIEFSNGVEKEYRR